jgi:adenylate kinase family enzyme
LQTSPSRVISIFGPPGAGKTTVAKALADKLDGVYVSSGDIARAVDPDALARGEMADRPKLREAFSETLSAALRLSGAPPVIVDGLPRDPDDMELLPDDTTYILLNCLPGIAMERQLRRGRPEDQPDLIEKRTREQRVLMGLDDPNGWSYRVAGWKQALATDRHRADYVIQLVTDYVLGRRSTIG